MSSLLYSDIRFSVYCFLPNGCFGRDKDETERSCGVLMTSGIPCLPSRDPLLSVSLLSAWLLSTMPFLTDVCPELAFL